LLARNPQRLTKSDSATKISILARKPCTQAEAICGCNLARQLTCHRELHHKGKDTRVEITVRSLNPDIAALDILAQALEERMANLPLGGFGAVFDFGQ
jgi:hypothetical protein